MLIISQQLLDEIFAYCHQGYPHEACGFVLGSVKEGRRCAQVIRNCSNIQNKLHAQDPKRYTRDAKTAYSIDPKEMQEAEELAKKKGHEILSIYHSHPEHGVYFSDEDKGMAAPWGEPLFPQLSYIVVSVYNGRVKEASEFLWNSDQKNFIEKKIL
ncbi:MAG: hypothetical protein A3G32_05590 [Deltaproteobacteria bacterium RIFCSPLOWO2_12_FULL_40_28]|nr:MAG: hypothetical protein A3C45_03760 [Deltaproteobacteria bacterium RIFCSPHIGHO2_02_FULL_40_28]OGQ18940.1 MAG: hypothetical protein A3E27_09590 [Deltaproteobacteria bacterium RIFCSPHIGHO2_12_FULL_40_32]OGQ39483.1 MAG: hypothetical protein A3I69_09705 [Deltaproteobacteria bacterium RIFCSPLOWO2_02_FULL_40_36]OGQ53373.1 MAG: hypothetical protein A3G32_05590 [Deltaproteobacteria bacterium RIFCSPLOWO2_12_FULL_40_28]